VRQGWKGLGVEMERKGGIKGRKGLRGKENGI